MLKNSVCCKGVLGKASWGVQQMSPLFAADVSLLPSATADPVVQDLLDSNKLVRDMHRSSAQSLHFHSSPSRLVSEKEVM